MTPTSASVEGRLEAIEAKGQTYLARQSFPDYHSFVHERDFYRHQLDWSQALQDPQQPRVLITAPPESYKSSTVRPFLEWAIGNNPDIRILLIMNTATQAQKQVMSVAETLENNPRYRQVFPGIKPNPKRGWSHEVLFVKRTNESLPDPTLYGTGIDGPYQGWHGDIIVVDDPTDQQDVFSGATMEAQRQRVRGVLLDRLVEGGKFFVILTRWGEADLVRDFREMGFAIIENPVEGRYPWGRLLCPEVFPDDRLQELRRSKGGALYQLTYMCNPAAAGGSLIKREWWRYYQQRPAISRLVHSWDIATGKSSLGDFSAYGSWGVGPDGFYLLDAGRWQVDMNEFIRKTQLLYSAQLPQWVLMEEAGVGIPIVQWLQKNTALPIRPVKPGSRDKVMRLQGIVHLIEAGRVWLPASAPWLQDFVDECAAFPGGQYDDQVDQTSQALEFLEAQGGLRGPQGVATSGVGGNGHRGRHGGRFPR